ncbi:hypothetical protein ElyMa_001373300 [Elysia marginata]|uniref:Uncharacterized protein n=1 Tax=Elysia marginata TaxID=1093978 RepID=A0AAV4ITC7_9GAST|nr:hypothetical protein ElyMa_001373300 [Elysia marginata]
MTPKRFLRSGKQGTPSTSNTGKCKHVLPGECIICKKDKYVVERLPRNNNEALVEFLFLQWCQASSNLLKNRVVFIAHGSFCYSISSDDQDVTVKPFEDSECDHEEAGTRMLLHARHIAASSDHIIIHSPDTNVLLSSLCRQSTSAMSS